MSREIDNKELSKILGIDSSLNITGTITVIKEGLNLPFVFLFDEHHGNLNNCIDKNIENGIELVTHADVVLAGVESHSGGDEWNQYEQDYYNDGSRYDCEISDLNVVNTAPNFAIEINRQNNLLVCGIECRDILDKIQCNPLKMGISDHPLNIKRSRHFVKTLFEHYNSINSNGNIILNCGQNHNSHIQEWVLNNEIESITNNEANYIRINTIN